MWPRLGVLLRAAVRVKRGGPRRDGLVLMDGVGIRESCRFRCLFGVVTCTQLRRFAKTVCTYLHIPEFLALYSLKLETR